MIEPFAGGAIVGLTAAFEGICARVTLVECDPDIAAVWRMILTGEFEWLADQIGEFRITDESVRAVLNGPKELLEHRAFATILRNRVQRGGIMAPGAGLMKEGENGKGLSCRWYPETLKRRILDIRGINGRVRFRQADGMKVLERNASRKDVVFFVDPPYTTAGRRLYRYSEVDHEELFRLMSKVRGDFLMTYDNTTEVRRWASKFGMATQRVAMKNSHHEKMNELLVGKDLSWVKDKTQLAFPEFDPRRPVDLQDARPLGLQPRVPTL